jgi:hypothetical protein
LDAAPGGSATITSTIRAIFFWRLRERPVRDNPARQSVLDFFFFLPRMANIGAGYWPPWTGSLLQPKAQPEHPILDPTTTSHRRGSNDSAGIAMQHLRMPLGRPSTSLQQRVSYRYFGTHYVPRSPTQIFSAAHGQPAFHSLTAGMPGGSGQLSAPRLGPFSRPRNRRFCGSTGLFLQIIRRRERGRIATLQSEGRRRLGRTS